MKNVFYFFSILFISHTINAQTWDWAKSLNVGLEDLGTSIGADKYGNVYITGRSYYYASGGGGSYYYEMFLKFSPNGNLIWQDTIPFYKTRSVTDADGNTYIAGVHTPKIAKYNSSGQLIWVKNTPNAGFNDLALFPEGGVVAVGGNAQGLPLSFDNIALSGNNRFFTARCDKDGNWLWAIDDDYFSASSITITKDKKIIEGGYAGYTNPFYIKRYDENGNFEMGMAPNLKQGIKDHTVDMDGNIYAIGELGGTDSLIVDGNLYQNFCPYANVFIIKYNSQGISQWVKTFLGYTTGEKIITDKNNNIYIAGQYDDSIKTDAFNYVGANQAFVVKIDSGGKTLWLKTSTALNAITSTGSGILDMVLDPSENLFMTGWVGGKESFDNTTLNVNQSYTDFLVAKINQPTVASVSNTNIISSEFHVYPNPTGGVFQITYFSTEKNNIQLNIIDSKGQMIFSEPAPQFQGEYKKVIDLSKQAKGIYYIEIISGRKKSVKKIILN